MLHARAALHCIPHLRADGGGGALAFFAAGLKLPGKSSVDWPSPPPPALLAVGACVDTSVGACVGASVGLDVTEEVAVRGTRVAVEAVFPEAPEGVDDRGEEDREENDRGQMSGVQMTVGICQTRLDARWTGVKQERIHCSVDRILMTTQLLAPSPPPPATECSTAQECSTHNKCHNHHTVLCHATPCRATIVPPSCWHTCILRWPGGSKNRSACCCYCCCCGWRRGRT